MKRNKLLSLFLVFVMLFCSVTVCADDSFNINMKLDMKSKGNIFFKGSVTDIEAKFFNNGNSDYDVTIKFNAVGRKYGKTWEYATDGKLNGGSAKTFNTKIDFERDIKVFDIYDLDITIASGDLSKNFSSVFSYVKYGKRNNHFGINTHFGGPDYRNTIDYAIPLLNNSGISIVRDSDSWSQYEKTKGTYAFTDEFEEVPDKLNDGNIDLLYTLLYNNSLYTSGSVKEIPSTDAERKAFAAYVTDVVTKLKGKAEYFELWNESNSNSALGGGVYADFIKEVYPAFKKANPDATLVGVCLNGNPSYNGQYLADALVGGAEGYMDDISWHPYVTMGTLQSPKGVAKPETFLYDWFSVFTNIYKNKNLGDIWTTEQGWNVYFGNTEDEVASNLVRSYAIEMEMGVEKYFWYEFIDSSVTYPLGFDAPTLKERIEGSFGILEGIKESTPMAAKPAFLAISAMNAAIGDKEYCGKEVTDGVYNFEFKNADEDSVHVVWTETEEKTTQIDFGSGCVIKTDLYGNEEMIYSDTGIYTITATPEPAYYQNGEMPKFHYSYDGENGLCTISGYVDSREEGKMLNFLVYKADRDYDDMMADNGKSISYFDQIITEEYGKFQYTFEPSGDEGYCIINLVDEDGEEMQYLLRLIEGMDCTVEIVNGEIENINPGDLIECNVKVNSNEPVTKAYDVYLAFFDGDRLTGIYKHSDSIINATSEITEFSVTVPESFDSIEAFAWEDGMRPIGDK